MKRTLPEAVRRNRFLAPLLVFILGIWLPLRLGLLETSGWACPAGPLGIAKVVLILAPTEEHKSSVWRASRRGRVGAVDSDSDRKPGFHIPFLPEPARKG